MSFLGVSLVVRRLIGKYAVFLSAWCFMGACARAELVPLEEGANTRRAPDVRGTAAEGVVSTGKGFPELMVGKIHHLNGNKLEATQWLFRALELGRQESIPILLQYMTDDPSSIAEHSDVLIKNLRLMAAQNDIIARGHLAYLEASFLYSLQPSATTIIYAKQSSAGGNSAGKCAMALLILAGKYKDSDYKVEALLEDAELAGFSPAIEIRKGLLQGPQHEIHGNENNRENSAPTHVDPYSRLLGS